MTLVLLLLLGFILSGVSAFAFGGNFGAMVNSILWAGSGVVWSQKTS